MSFQTALLPNDDEDPEKNSPTPKEVKKWFRQASGPFQKEYLNQCYDKLFEEAVKSAVAYSIETKRPYTK